MDKALTDAGVELLATTTGVDVQRRTDSYESDIAIVCALEFPEFAAVTKAAHGRGALWRENTDARFPHVYRETALTIAGGK